MNVKGKLTQKLDKETGESKAGKQWSKQGIVIDTGDQFNPLVCVSFFGDDKIEMLNKYSVGSSVDVAVNISSREFNGKWYHNIDGWKIEGASADQKAVAVEDSESDSLPF